MNKLFGSAAIVAVLSLAVVPARAATTFVSATATSNASADTDQGQADYGQGFGTKSKTASSLQPTVSATAAANAVSYADDGIETDSANALEQSHGDFSSAASGVLDLAGITSSSTFGAGETAEAYSEGQNVGYTFTVSTTSIIDLTYSFEESYTGCCASAQIYLGTPTFSSQLYNATPPLNSSGTLSFDLAPGTYLLNLNSQVGDDAYAADGASAFGEHEERVSFDISAAPEPGMWALLMVAVGLAGSVLRRRRGQNALAV